jgi:hypothetical protein
LLSAKNVRAVTGRAEESCRNGLATSDSVSSNDSGGTANSRVLRGSTLVEFRRSLCRRCRFNGVRSLTDFPSGLVSDVGCTPVPGGGLERVGLMEATAAFVIGLWVGEGGDAQAVLPPYGHHEGERGGAGGMRPSRRRM